MPRPAFSLSDAQARELMSQTEGLQHQFPLDRRDHRPFVRGFLRAVHQVTGHLYSPAVYRRLLAAYAADRRPSTATLAIEKAALLDELARGALAEQELCALPASNLAGLVRSVLMETLDLHGQPQPKPQEHYARAQVEFLLNQLAQAERARQEASARAAARDAELRAAKEYARRLAEELDFARASNARQVQLLETLTAQLDGNRAFAMKAIDEVRGETRAWKERCTLAEAQLREEKLLLETFRQLAYQRGAAIPTELQPEHSK